ncbi:MAG: diguanylate cyclase [Burkholderiaceae bacterium]
MTGSIASRHHRVPARNHPLRVGGLFLGCLPIVSMLAEQRAGPSSWGALAACILVWPHLALLLAYRHHRPMDAERRNLTIDQSITVFWLAATGFSPLPTVALLSMQASDKLSVGGWRLLLRSWAWSLPGAAAALWLYRPSFSLEVSSLTILACLPNLVFYPLAVGSVNFRLTRQLVEQRMLLRRLNRDDRLTGLANNRFWEETVAIELNRLRHTRRPAAILLIEIDDFPAITEHCGAAVGDALLREVGDVLRQVSREIDTPGRRNGHAYCLMLPEAGPELARQVAEQIRVRIRQIRIDGLAIAPSASIGLAMHDERVNDVTGWVAQADVALYRARTSGGDTITRWSADTPWPAARARAHGEPA